MMTRSSSLRLGAPKATTSVSMTVQMSAFSDCSFLTGLPSIWLRCPFLTGYMTFTLIVWVSGVPLRPGCGGAGSGGASG